MQQLLLDIQPPPAPSFNNFIAGRNLEAITNIQAAIQGQAPSQFVYLWGEKGSGKTHLLKAAQAMGAVVMDDVHLLTAEAQIDLFNQFNKLKAAEQSLVTAGLHAPAQLSLREDLATRLAWGLVYQLHPLTDQEKAEALQAHAKARGMKLPEEVITYCLRYLRRDLPYLMTTLDALDQWSLQTKKSVTVPLLKQLLASQQGALW